MNIDDELRGDIDSLLNEINRNGFIPRLIICKVENRLVFTTKKIASRYFTDMSVDENNQTITCEFEFINPVDQTDDLGENDLEFFKNFSKKLNLFYRTAQESRIDKDVFFDKLGIKNFDDLFSKKITDDYEIFFVIKEPFERLLTASVELVEANFKSLFSSSIARKLIAEKYKINTTDAFQFRKTDFEKVREIFIEIYEEVMRERLNDMHVSHWHQFVTNLYNLFEDNFKIQILDLSNPTHPILNEMNKFVSDSNTVSNEKMYTYIIQRDFDVIKNLTNLFRFYLYYEIKYYNILKKIKK